MRNPATTRDVVVVGRACRLPGAASVDQLWDNLLSGRCTVTSVPEDRWSLARHYHPRPKEPGKSYVWAAGVLDDVWGFDPAPFGISPREAEQMDPQQRLLLELTWEALEDAGLKRSDIGGEAVGVYVGASSTEYQNIRGNDVAGSDAYTATGGALSIVSNRISHAFDLQGPSLTIDTACSSSLVALHHAMEALRSGLIDTAIVGGVNVLLSPFGFILFSQASMLSPNGLCRTFDAKADGYVRAEGGVVLVLQTAAAAARSSARVHGSLVASGVNSDGHTNGIALPSRFAQGNLLNTLYERHGIDPSRLAFVEAHGTGTRVGDPIEAATIGKVLGKPRSERLPIGSIKSNIGHLEPASGLAGVLKTLLALEHDVLPPSLHFDEPNPDIDFDDLNLEVCTAPMPLRRRDGPRYAGVNSFGFGGTNAHVVVGDAPPRPAKARRQVANSDLFAVSAASQPALRDLSRRFATTLAAATFDQTREFVAAAAHRRDMLGERAVVEWSSPRDLVRKLERIADKEADVPGVTHGTVTETDAPVAFVFSGNGSQWPGMGRASYGTSRRFRESFDEIDALFDAEFGWSITEALFAPDIEQNLRLTHVAQPLIFAIQVSVARTLMAEGLQPAFSIGHSVGEIAAATVAGALSLREGVRVIQARSAHQESIRDTGRMAVVLGGHETIAALCQEVGSVEIAAENSPRAFTVAGTTDAVAELGRLAKQRRLAFRQLDLDYPFHCSLIDPVREPLLRDLGSLTGAVPQIPMISTVTGELVEEPLDGLYWWRNVREPVRFTAALERAAEAGARIFIEIGPRSVLLGNIRETLDSTAVPYAALGVLERREAPEDREAIRAAVLAAFTRGASVELDKLFGAEPAQPVALPTYPWARRDFRVGETGEAVGFALDTRWHRLAGARNTADGLEWSNLMDTTALPELADHEVGGQAILPGAAFVEMALAVSRGWFRSDQAGLLEIDIAQPLVLERDRGREVRCRLSPATATLEIMSRPRLAKSGWTVHAIARLTGDATERDSAALPAATGEPISAAEIYRAAEAVGLRYGPRFRLLRSATPAGDGRFLADLLPSEPHGAYGVDPARLDACFHGLFALLGVLGAEDRGTAYIPVRFGHTRMLRPGEPLARAVIDVIRAGEGSIVADFTLLDAQGGVIGHLHDARFQAARVQRPNLLADKALVTGEIAIDRGAIGRRGSPVTSAAILAAAAREEDAAQTSGAAALLDGWAASAGLELAHALSRDGVVKQDDMAADGEERGRWLAHMMRTLGDMDLATETGSGWKLADPSALPPARAILDAVAAEHPDRSAELLLAGRLSGWTSDRAGTRSPQAAPVGIVEAFDLGSTSARSAGELLARFLGDAGYVGAALRGLRILQVGYGPLSHRLATLVEANEARLTVLDLDARRIERARLALEQSQVRFAGATADLAGQQFDLVVAAEGLSRFRLGGGSPVELRSLLAADCPLVAVEPIPSLFRDLALGLSPGWFAGGAREAPIGPLQGAQEWREELAACGFANVSASGIVIGGDEATLIVAEAEASSTQPETSRRAIVIESQERAGSLATRLEAVLARDDHDVHLAGREDIATDASAEAPIRLVLAAPASGKADLADLKAGVMALRDAAARCGEGKGELWYVVTARAGRAGGADPVAAGLLAAARTLANEAASLTVRTIRVEPGIDSDRVSETLRTLLATPQVETDFVLGPDSVTVSRIGRLGDLVARQGEPGPARLERGAAGGLAGLDWRPAERAVPKADEVEITVEATGLNFRDVMWAMSLLPDDILEDGYAGPTLGLECAGTVRSVGSGVTRFRPGDRVLAFAASAFSTSVAVPEAIVAPLPTGWPTEAGASVPVAFLTAYYGLVTLAGMKAGDWVLIHGAAGGVGLAAVQIAQWRGATVVATAGSPEKRDLLRALGVEHVLDSRSTAFVDDLRALRRGGVEIVLNSLAGEAMERGLATLKPFGRFIELGKRDYVANTQIGLRPFKRNLSYFGVDVDQLLSDGDRASAIFGELMALFETGDLRPLPYRVFSAEETIDAFRLMQQSGHVGKILLRPPASVAAKTPSLPFTVDPDRTHLVTGGFGGFGLETARWLADRGARHLVLIGRNGPQGPESEALLAELAERGVSVLAARCDVTREKSLSALLRRVEAELPPLAGVLHAAMVLDDGLIANLTEEQLTRVLAPKVAGAELLDRLTAGSALDYFVMFSSITTFIGNPGQSAYVAANAYLEGLARHRRASGRPGLALAWGAISDVGVLARQKGLAEVLTKRAGVHAMPAREALDLMAQALSSSASDPTGAVLAVGSLDWSAARRLPALSSPTFSALTRGGSVADSSEKEGLDLRLLLMTEPEEAVRRRVIEVIIEEIAAVLRVPKADVSPAKRLAEMGLDSLMAIELASGLQDRFRLDAPPSGSVGALTTMGLADQLIGLVSAGQPDEEARVTQALNDRHAGVEVDADALAPLVQAATARTRDMKGLLN